MAADSVFGQRSGNRRKLLIDEKVEVRSLDDGFHGSWHPGIVVDCGNRTRQVKYDYILADDSLDRLVEFVTVSATINGGASSANGASCHSRGLIRPLPPTCDCRKWSLHYGLCVDAFYMDAWWEGVIFDNEDGSEVRKIFFPDLGDELMVEINLLRITQDWNEATEVWERRGNWLFLELIEEYEQEWPICVSIKQIWYDARLKKGFEKLGDWTCLNKSVWRELVLEVIEDNFKLTLDEFFIVIEEFELSSPAADVTLKHNAELLNSPAVIPVDNTSQLNSHLVANCENVMESLDCNMEEVKKMTKNHSSSTGRSDLKLNSIQNIEVVFNEEDFNLDDLDFVKSNELGLDMDLLMNSYFSCNDEEGHMQPQASSILPSDPDGISSISTYNEGFSAAHAKKVNGTSSFSTCKKKQIWLPAGPDMLPGAEFCPDAISEYALCSVNNQRPSNSLTTNVRKHLSYLGWKFEFKKDKGGHRMRYTSPDGTSYHSLLSICKNLREPLGEIHSPIFEDDHKSLCASPNDFFSCQLIDQSHEGENITVVQHVSDPVVVEPEYCPQSVVDWYSLGLEKNKLDSQKILDKAKRHLAAVGWVFRYAYKGTRREMRYFSPRGKCYCSLRRACKGCMDEGGIAESYASVCKLVEGTTVRGESESTEFHENSASPEKWSMELPEIPSSREIVEFGKVNLRGGRKLQNKRKSGLLHLASHMLQSQAKAHLHDKQDKLLNGLVGIARQGQLKEQNACFPKMKKRKVCEAPIMDGNYPTRMLRSRKLVRQVGGRSSLQHNPRTVLSWLIDNNVVLPRAKVHYRCKKDYRSMAEGRIARDGIKCSCCQKVFTLSSFEAHAGSTYHRPAANIFLEDGRSLLECQMQEVHNSNMRCLTAKTHNREEGNRHYSENDCICSVCHYGGNLILCDQCPSSFHMDCLGLKDVPAGDWFCPSCCCGICGQSKLNGNTDNHIDQGVLNCDQCERQYHVGCLQKIRPVMQPGYSKRNHYCSKVCEKIYLKLHRLLGKPVPVGAGNLTWTLLKSSKYDKHDLDIHDVEASAENYSKLNVALSVIHECFEPTKDPLSRRDIAEDVIFSRGSELKRLNFRGFYTVLLERNDELISVATVRIHGKKVAEVPLVGTRFQFRRLGMCHILMNELEKKLKELGVERMVLPAVPSVLNTWTISFGFSKMTDSERLEFLGYTFLDFQDTVMCQKLLVKIPDMGSRGTHHKLHDDMGDNVDIDGYSPVSDVSQAELIEDSGTVHQGPADDTVGKTSNGCKDSTLSVVLVTRSTYPECKTSNHEVPDCSVENSSTNLRRSRDDGGYFKHYKRRRISASECAEP